MTAYELLSLAQDRSTSGTYLFDPDGMRALWVGNGRAEEVTMGLQSAYALTLLPTEFTDDYFEGAWSVDVDDLCQAQALGPESLMPLDRIHVEPLYIEDLDLMRMVYKAMGDDEPATR